MRRSLVLLAVPALLLAACSSGGDSAATATSATSTTVAATTAATDAPVTEVPTTDVVTTEAPTTDAPITTGPDLTAGRPYTVFTPSTYDGSTPMPLIILLHGFGATGAIQEAYFRLEPLAESKGFLYVHPDGTLNAINKQFWNATDACCGFGRGEVDDSAYLLSLIEQVQAKYNVDATRIYFVGHSNGGFMSYRMACDHADKVAAIVSLAGDTWLDPTKCAPTEPVNILQVQGTNDGTINYNGGSNLGFEYPSAQQSVATWAGYNGCGTTPADTGTTLDLEKDLPAAESTVSAFPSCPADGAVELWTIPGGSHIPGLSDQFSPAIIDWLFAHPKVLS